MNSGQLKRAKKLVRHAVLARRDALAPEERARLGALVTDRLLALAELEAAGTVMAFWSFGSELTTMPLIRLALDERGPGGAAPDRRRRPGGTHLAAG